MTPQIDDDGGHTRRGGDADHGVPDRRDQMIVLAPARAAEVGGIGEGDGRPAVDRGLLDLPVGPEAYPAPVRLREWQARAFSSWQIARA